MRKPEGGRRSGEWTPRTDAHLAAFGHAARGSCPLSEIEYGGIKADPLFQPHRLADLAAFYRAFGLEVAEDAGERHDHLCLELEFTRAFAESECARFAVSPGSEDPLLRPLDEAAESLCDACSLAKLLPGAEPVIAAG